MLSSQKEKPSPKSSSEHGNEKVLSAREKISVNSTTVIKNDIVERLEKQPLIFLQYTINTVICQGSSTVSLLEWSVAEWKQTDCAGSA